MTHTHESNRASVEERFYDGIGMRYVVNLHEQGHSCFLPCSSDHFGTIPLPTMGLGRIYSNSDAQISGRVTNVYIRVLKLFSARYTTKLKL